MMRVDLKYIAAAIADLSGIPVRLFEGDERLLFQCVAPLSHDPMALCHDALWKINARIGYYLMDDLSYYGVIRSGETRLIIGPTRRIAYEDQELRQLAFRLDVSAMDRDAFISGMKSIVRMPFEVILQILCVINHVISGEKLRLSDVEILGAEQDSLKTAQEQKSAGRHFEEAREPHNTMAIENEMLEIIRRGNTATMQEWLANAPAIRSGILAAEQLRQRKNLFVVAVTLASRAAIRGGMDPEDALSLSDSFIQSCELMSDPGRIINLQFHMLLEYTERVERIRRGGNPTPFVIAATNYIRQHLSETISVEKMAKALYLSRPHLSAKFKKETGETLTGYILREKTEEAKRLLRYSDKTASAIGLYLGFSSLGHFSRVFKKYVGVTPSEYRQKYS